VVCLNWALAAVVVAEAAAEFPELFPRNKASSIARPVSVIFDIVLNPLIGVDLAERPVALVCLMREWQQPRTFF
jgi:hypothetical protein